MYDFAPSRNEVFFHNGGDVVAAAVNCNEAERPQCGMQRRLCWRSRRFVQAAARPKPLTTRGHRFEPVRDQQTILYASIAQSVEHAAVNRGVTGSSPV